MTGYNGWSMSNNAVQAYEDGEKPLSKWTKKTFIDIIADMTGKDEEEVKKALKPYAVSTLRSQLLGLSSWHHTSSHYNRTNFYSIETLETLDEFIYVISGQREKDEEARLQAHLKFEEEVMNRYDGKMPLDVDAVLSMWRFAWNTGRKGKEEQCALNWLMALYSTADKIDSKRAELDALIWVPADREKFMEIAKSRPEEMKPQFVIAKEAAKEAARLTGEDKDEAYEALVRLSANEILREALPWIESHKDEPSDGLAWRACDYVRENRKDAPLKMAW